MELDAVDRQLAVADGHHLAFVAGRGDLELVRDALRGERVVAARLEARRKAGEEALPVVVDGARLAVDEPSREPDLAAERFDDRLVAEADAERRHPRAADERGDARPRPPRAGRVERPVGPELRGPR